MFFAVGSEIFTQSPLLFSANRLIVKQFPAVVSQSSLVCDGVGIGVFVDVEEMLCVGVGAEVKEAVID